MESILSKNNILVVGSVALDSVKTPFGEVKDTLGGSATYASYTSNFFVPVNLIAVVGNDFPQEYLKFLRDKSIDLEGLEIKKGKTFRWEARYKNNLNERDILKLALNVFENFNPHISQEARESKYLFLSNIDPELQLRVLEQVENPKLVLADTITYWIEERKTLLLKLLKKVNIFLLNDLEAKELTGEFNLVKAGYEILSFGPQIVIIKKGEHGSLMFSSDSLFSIPGYPLEKVYDPTGAGDSFAGGFLGYLAETEDLSKQNIRKAIVYGTILASFCVEGFSLNGLKSLTKGKIEKRYEEFKKITQF